MSARLPGVGGGAGRREGGAAVRGDVEDGGQPQVLQTQAQEGRQQVRRQVRQFWRRRRLDNKSLNKNLSKVK